MWLRHEEAVYLKHKRLIERHKRAKWLNCPVDIWSIVDE